MEVTDCRGKIAGEPDARYISHPVDAADCSPEAALHTRDVLLSLPQAWTWAPDYIHFRGLSGGPAGPREKEGGWEGPALSSGSHISRDLVEKPCTVRGVCAYTPFACIWPSYVSFPLRFSRFSLSSPLLSSRRRWGVQHWQMFRPPVSTLPPFFHLLFLLFFIARIRIYGVGRILIPVLATHLSAWISRCGSMMNTRRNLIAHENSNSRTNRVLHHGWKEKKKNERDERTMDISRSRKK